jgi:hypothetical protein
MSQDEVTQIRVGSSPVGVVGLKSVLQDMVNEYGDRPDREIREELLNRLDKKNYISERAREDYEKAFLREFKKYLGKPSEEEAPEGIQIKVLGPGCVQCDRLEQELIAVMAEGNIMANIDHVRDPKEIGTYEVMGTPALIINDVVKCVGKVPPRGKIKEWIKEVKKED